MNHRAVVLIFLAAASAVKVLPADLVYGGMLSNYSADVGYYSAGSLPYGIAADLVGNLHVMGAEGGCYPVPHTPAYKCTYSGWMRTFASNGKDQIQKATLPGNTRPTAIAVDAAGNTYLTGTMFDPPPPATADVFQNSGGPGFLAKLGADGRLLWLAYISGTPSGLAVDPASNVYVTGAPGTDFRTTPGALKEKNAEADCSQSSTYRACVDAFVIKIKPDGNALIYSTLIGGSRDDRTTAIAVDGSGAAWITGVTFSPDFPVTPGAFQAGYGGTQTVVYDTLAGPQSYGDAFVARLAPDGKSLLFGTFLGGTGGDAGTGIAVDREGNGFVMGTTRSEDFPIVGQSWQQSYGGDLNQPYALSGDAFFAKFTAAGTLIYSSFLGGPESEIGGRVIAAPDGRIFLTAVGRFAPILESRDPGVCEPKAIVIQLDPETGQIASYQALASTDGSTVLGPAPELAVGAEGLLAVLSVTTQASDPFPLTPDHLNEGGWVRLRLYDFTRPSKPSVSCVANAASMTEPRYDTGALAPGEIISFVGTGLGPEIGVAAVPDVTGKLPENLMGTTVTVAGVRCAVLYVQDRQINAMIPYSAKWAPLSSYAAVSVERNGQMIGTYGLGIREANPGYFTSGPAGTGQVVAWNEDGALNSLQNPAGRETRITVLATGFGPLYPLPADGAVTPLNSPVGKLPGQAVSTNYAVFEPNVLSVEAIPGQVSGLVAIKAWIPPTAKPGRAPAIFCLWGYPRSCTQATGFIAVK